MHACRAGFVVLSVGQCISGMKCCSSKAAVQDTEDPAIGLAANQARFHQQHIFRQSLIQIMLVLSTAASICDEVTYELLACRLALFLLQHFTTETVVVKHHERAC